MPIMYVNPAPSRRRKKVTKKRRSVKRRNPSRKKRTATKTKDRATTRRKRTASSTARRKNPARVRAAKKAARTRAAKKAMRTRAARKAAMSRRRNPSRKGRRRNAWSEPKTKSVSRKVAAGHRKAALKGWANRRKKKASSGGSRPRGPGGRFAKRNPAGRAYMRRYKRKGMGRRNPSSIKDMVMQVAPVAGSLYFSRLVSGKLAGKVPGLDRLPMQFRQPVLAGGLAIAGHFATMKVRQLRKYRGGIMVGLGVNLLDKLLGAFAPANVKEMFGISNYGEDIYGPALSDYVAVEDYVAVDGTPIQDNITLSDYVAVGEYEGLEQELGAFQDLGVEQDLGEAFQDLGDFTDRNLGGVSRSAMRAPVGTKKFLAPVPSRSFTAPIARFGGDFDKPEVLYTGIFSGGPY